MELIYNKYEIGSERQSHQTKDPEGYIGQQIAASFDKEGRMKLFTSIEIETINRCNLSCPFCPAGRKHDKRQEAKMQEGLFRKIILDLKNMNYCGKVALHSNNEPFLDERLLRFLEYAKKQLPKAHHRLYTNGTLLTVEKFKEVMHYLDTMVIDNYDDELRLIPSIKEIFEYCQGKEEYKNCVNIHLRKINEQLTTRGGQAPNRIAIDAPEHGCFLPFYQMIVRPTGELSLCNSDYYGRYTMGNLNEQTPKEAWYGQLYQDMREKLRVDRRTAGGLCKFCDMVK